MTFYQYDEADQVSAETGRERAPRDAAKTTNLSRSRLAA
jgi:hypothetical protein